MPNWEPLIVGSQAFYELLVHPHFADLIPDGPYSGTLGEFTVMDDVVSKRKIIDILGSRNILKRRDASCNIDFTPVAKGGLRTIEVETIYGATLQCDNEFYQGCFKDFISQHEKFRNYVLTFFEKAIKVDLDSNAYFGDITRPDDPSGLWNWNVFDGIFKKYKRYINSGVIPAARAITISTGTMTPLQAFNTLNYLFDNQEVLLKSMPPTMKSFYVSDALYYGYHKYLQQIGSAYNIGLYTNGIPQLSFNGIPMFLEPTWSPVMTALNGGKESHAAILTIRGNFVFATDKTYGEGPALNEALRIWYSDDDMVWKYAMFMKAGTEIALPEYSVIAMTPIP